MTETKIADFIFACVKEIESRLGLQFKTDDLVENLAARGLQDKVVSLDDYRRAVEYLERYARPEEQALFEGEVPEISPTHFVRALTACDPNAGDKEHLAGCQVCSQSLARLTNAAIWVLLGTDSESADSFVQKQHRSDLTSALSGAISSSLGAVQPLLNWSQLMFDPAYLALAFRAVDGLDPEQGRKVLTLASSIVGEQPAKPDTDRFKDILRKTRELVEIGSR